MGTSKPGATATGTRTLQATILGPSLTVPVNGAKLVLGETAVSDA